MKPVKQKRKTRFNPLDFYTLLGLAIATSIDSLAAGLGLSLVKVYMILAATLISIVTFSLSFMGVFIEHKIGDKFNSKIEIIGAIILIFLGVKVLIAHLNGY